VFTKRTEIDILDGARAAFPPMAPLTICMIRLMSKPDMMRYSRSGIQFAPCAWRRTIAARYNLSVCTGKVMLQQRRIRAKNAGSLVREDVLTIPSLAAQCRQPDAAASKPPSTARICPVDIA